MAKLWEGRSNAVDNRLTDDFNASIRFDQRLYKQDIQGSMAHAAMLGAQGINSPADTEAILIGLQQILDELEAGTLQIDLESEDIHSFVEQELTRRIGSAGQRLHTGRSRNDQVAVDLRLWLRDQVEEIQKLLRQLLQALVDQAEQNQRSIMPGYTHLQRAQPITFAHHLLAYAMMFARDIDRLRDASHRMNQSPLGSAALAGTSYPIDRQMTATQLGFEGIMMNSIDGVSDRDYALELMGAFSILMMHLSRLSEELVLWSSWEFRFIELDDRHTTGSSIMPQKKNPDLAELCRGKTGRVYGDLLALLTTMKGLPLAYNKDMQEDKEAIFDSVDTVKACLTVAGPMIAAMKTHPEIMRTAAQKGFINATDVADYLVGKGLPFRAAYKIVGQLVAYCTETGQVLETLPLPEYQRFSDLFQADVYPAIALEACVEKRNSQGGTSSASLQQQLDWLQPYLLSGGTGLS